MKPERSTEESSFAVPPLDSALVVRNVGRMHVSLSGINGKAELYIMGSASSWEVRVSDLLCE